MRLLVYILAATILYAPKCVAATKDQLMAAAAMAGMLSGMAAACNFDGKPILMSLRRALDRSNLSNTEKEDAKNAVLNASGLGLSLQSKPGSMPCGEVEQRLQGGVQKIDSLK
jgi:hypothetical protein